MVMGSAMPENQNDFAKLSNQFFQVFSRTEYALKATGFHKGKGDAKANWEMFADEIEDRINDCLDSDFKQAIKYLSDRPPKKQIIDDNDRLRW